jgi:diguanylate cyclase (GGDEF)-like protein
LLLAVSSCVRDTDTDTVARIGGDEFVIVINDLDAERDAATLQTRSVAETIRTRLAEPYVLRVADGNAQATLTHACTASIGIALFSGHEPTQAQIFRMADAAMYQAKESGRNQAAVHAGNDDK